jgi:hypothetical protein
MGIEGCAPRAMMQRVESKGVAGKGAREVIENKRVILHLESVGKRGQVGMLRDRVIGRRQDIERMGVTARSSR